MSGAASLIADIGDRPWLDNRACTTTNTGLAPAALADVFHPTTGKPRDETPARTICRTCPAIEDCLEWALTTVNDNWGVNTIIADTNHHDRTALRQQRARQVRAARRAARRATRRGRAA
jgi:hypothetical protein